MTSVIPARRRAEEFAALVDGARRRRRRTRHDERSSSWSPRARAAPPPRRAPARVRRRPARAALMAEAETALARSADSRARRSRPHPPHAAASAASRSPRGGRRPARRRHLDGRGRPGRPARRRALPGQAGHRERRRPALQVDEVAKGDDAARQRQRPPRRGRRAPVAATPPSGDAAHRPTPSTTSPTRPTEAADLLLADYAAHRRPRRGRPSCATFTAESMDTLVELGAELPASARADARATPPRSLAQIDAAAPRPPAPSAAAASTDGARRCSCASVSDGLSARRPTADAAAPPVADSPIARPRRPQVGRRARERGPADSAAGDGPTAPRRCPRRDADGDAAGGTDGRRPGSSDLTNEGPRRPAGVGPDGPVERRSRTTVVDPLLDGVGDVIDGSATLTDVPPDRSPDAPTPAPERRSLSGRPTAAASAASRASAGSSRAPGR